MLEITNSYRKARRNTSLFCGIGLAWSAAQFNIKDLNTNIFGNIDLSNTYIPTVLICLIIFLMIRCTTEFMMQPVEVRRWSLAQIDYKITLNLLRISILALSTSVTLRSMKTITILILSMLALILLFFILTLITMLIVMPIIMRLRKSVASAALEASGWSIFIVFIIYILIYAILPLVSNNNFSYFFPPTSNIVFCVTVIMVILTFMFEGIFLKKVFAFVPKYIEEELTNSKGEKYLKIYPNPSHPDNNYKPFMLN